MAGTSLHQQQLYEQGFQPVEYLQKFSADGTVKEGIFSWFADRFYDIFKTGKVNGSRLLDVGTGPNIYTLISACPHVDSIVLSEFLPQNRRTLKQWLDGTLGFSFRPLVKYITDREKNGQTAEMRESEIKRKVNAIIPLDLVQDEPVFPCFLPQFSVITSSLCLEVVGKEVSDYMKTAKWVTSHLQPGGHLVLCGVLEETFYTVGGTRFENCYLTAQQVKDTWTEAGLTIVEWQEKDVSHIPDTDLKGLFIMLARK